MSETNTATAIITGASRGIGPHIAKAFAGAGYPVVLVARTLDLLEAEAKDIRTGGGKAVSVQADVTIAHNRERVLAMARTLGPVGVLVNNAAVGPIANFHDHTDDDINDVIAVNLAAPMAMARLVVADMLLEGRGRILNVATVAAKLPMPHMALYSATKAGLAQFSTALDLEYRDRGIRTGTVFPGAVLEEGMSVRSINETGVDIPNDGAVLPQVVAQAVLAAAANDEVETYLDAGSRFMARHPRIAYALIKRTGAYESLGQAAYRYQEINRIGA